jgi:hypothetical protein
MQMLDLDTDEYVCPDFYVGIQAARYLNVAPWDLLEQSVWWRDKALISMTAEKQARDVVNKPKG